MSLFVSVYGVMWFFYAMSFVMGLIMALFFTLLFSMVKW